MVKHGVLLCIPGWFGTHCTGQDGSDIALILLPLSPECCDCTCVPPSSGSCPMYFTSTLKPERTHHVLHLVLGCSCFHLPHLIFNSLFIVFQSSVLLLFKLYPNPICESYSPFLQTPFLLPRIPLSWNTLES